LKTIFPARDAKFGDSPPILSSPAHVTSAVRPEATQVETSTKMKPTVLVVTTTRWSATARLAMALARAGYNVEALCPARHPVEKTSAVRRTHTYRGLMPLMSLTDAIAASKPDLIVPGDDLATRHLYHLYDRKRLEGNGGESVCALITRSLGAPDGFPVVCARASLIESALQEGIRVPKTEVILNDKDLSRWLAQSGFPTVLKANGTTGGVGVRIVNTVEEAEHAFRLLQAPPLFARAVKRALMNSDRTLLWPSLLRRQSVVNGQMFVPGQEATSMIACWEGKVLASLQFEVLKKKGPFAPATVVRLIENAEMSHAARRMANRLKLSGLHGFDFMLEEHTQKPYLIEINPRATQVGHLTLGPGRDLPAALYAAISGEPIRPAPKLTEHDTITLFPQEWITDPTSPFLKSSYHDVPWEEPELVRACVHTGLKRGFKYFQHNWLIAHSKARASRPELLRPPL
jgi:hypothetical protein